MRLYNKTIKRSGLKARNKGKKRHWKWKPLTEKGKFLTKKTKGL